MNTQGDRLHEEQSPLQANKMQSKATCDECTGPSMEGRTSHPELPDSASTNCTSSAPLPPLAPFGMSMESVTTPTAATTSIDTTSLGAPVVVSPTNPSILDTIETSVIQIPDTSATTPSNLCGGDNTCGGNEGEEGAFLTNGSIALAEFTSLLKPAENSALKEHIIHLLQDVDTEETLVRIAQALETDEMPVDVSSTTLTESSRDAASYANVSQSTSASNTTHRRRSSNASRPYFGSFEALAGFSFLSPPHAGTMSGMLDSPSSAPPSDDAGPQSRLSRGLGGPMDTSLNSRSSRSAHDEERRYSKQRDESLSTFMAPDTADPITTGKPLITMSTLPTATHIDGRRVAVSAAPCTLPLETIVEKESATALPPLQVVPKTAVEELQLRRLLHRCHTFSSLEASTIESVTKAMDREVHAAGVAILEQDKPTTEKLYLVGEGTCEIIKNGKSLGSLPPGGTFGELELMYKQAKCAATIRCVTRCVLYTLDDTSYHRVIMASSLQKRHKFEQLTMNVPFLRCLPDFERMTIAEALETRVYKRGKTIIRFGSPGNYMHFIIEGEVKVIGRNRGRRVEVVRLCKGDVVGELEFLFNHLTVADVVATSREVRTACISREHFELIIGPIQDRLKEFVATSSTYEKYYVAEVANESVRTELNRIESSRKHRRVAWQDEETSIGVTDPRGEVLLSAPRALLRGKCGTAVKAEDANDGVAHRDPEAKEVSVGTDAREARRQAAFGSPGALPGTSLTTTEALEEAGGDSAQLPKVLLRFPFAPITGNEVAVLALREDGLIINWNSVLEKLTSYSAEEVVGQNIYSFLLSEREQQAMYRAINTARGYAGESEEFLKRPNIKSSQFTLARRDGLTKTTIRLTIVPPVVSAGCNAAEVVLGFGEEVREGPQKMLEQPQWLSGQIRAILADGTQTFEERLECIAETLNNFESTYRAMTVSTERLRVVNIRQMMGHVLMDFGSECVSRGVSVRQCFEGLPSERAYLDADLLPECLRYAMRLCLKYSSIGNSIITIMITVTEKNGLEFLVMNFNLTGDSMPKAIAKFFDSPLNRQGNSSTMMSIDAGEDDNSDGDGDSDEEGDSDTEESLVQRHTLRPRLRRKLRRVQRAVEDQGGTLRMLRNPQDSNIVFLIPFMPASDHDAENASVEESLSTLADSISASQSVSLAGMNDVLGHPASGTAPGNGVLTSSPGGENSGLSNLSAAGVPVAASGQPNFSYTTCLAEDTPAHRVMLSSFLWERHHAVLTAFSFEDVLSLTGVADILIIDLQQSAVSFLQGIDPITRLREILRHMAVIITSTNFDLVSSDTYTAAGFITLKKPCTPVQAMRAIRRAEERSAAVKLERLRIEQTRETLSRNSRGAWRQGALLGKGTFGEVYEAYDLLTGGKMAVKVMRLGSNDAKIEQFVQEISTMCNLQHPNIIHYFYCEESSSPRLIRVFMEFASGGTLQSLLKKKGKLEYVELRALLRDIVEGIAYIHSQHYVHGDIKTANVLLSTDGKGKIGDFGTARTVQDGELLYVMQGSPLYMSPECMSAGEEDEEGTKVGYSFPSDIWSLGCVAMEMATNKPPFAHIKTIKGPAGLTKYVTSLTDVPDLSPLFKCHASVVEFVSACLNPDPKQRATAQDLLQMSLFSESTCSDRNSAVKALKRAQLLHVLNKFVAFQEPQEAAEREKQRRRFTVRRVVSDYFSSSSNSSHPSHSSNVSDAASAHPSKAAPATESERVADKRRRQGTAFSLAAAATGSKGKEHNHSGSVTPRRSVTVARAPDGACMSSDSDGVAPGKAEASLSNTLSAADGSSAKRPSPPTRYLRYWNSSSSCSSSSSLEEPRMPTAMATTAADGEGRPKRAPNPYLRHSTGLKENYDDAEPDARNPQLGDTYDLSPTPKQRSKTRSRLQASPTPPAQMSVRRGRGHDSASTAPTANSAEDDFFATSSESAGDEGARNNSCRAPKKASLHNEVLAHADDEDWQTHDVAATSEGPQSTGVESVGCAPSFLGRRRNVRLDEAGNIVPFERIPSNRSEPRREGFSTRGGVDVPVAGDAEVTNTALRTRSSVSATCLANASFAQPPANFSFFSFNKNISFMGSNMEEVLNSAANDFLNNLAAYSHMSNPPGGEVASNAGSTAPLTTKPFTQVERLDSGRSHVTGSSNMDGGGPVDEHGEEPDLSCPKRDQALSRSPSARNPQDTCGRGDSASSEGGVSATQKGEAIVSHPHVPLPKPLLVTTSPPLVSRPAHPATSNMGSASCTSDDVTAIITPRCDSAPVMWAAASGYRKRRVRPPITNHSFFTVEDRSLPYSLPRGGSTSVPPFLPVADSTTMTGLKARGPPWATRVSLTTMSSVNSGDGGEIGGSQTSEHQNSLFTQHFRHTPALTPLPSFSTFATGHARATWQQRHRGEMGSGPVGTGDDSLSYGCPSAPLSDENSAYAFVSNEQQGHEQSRLPRGTAANDDDDPSSNGDRELPSAAFASMHSGYSENSFSHSPTDFVAEVPTVDHEQMQKPYDAKADDIAEIENRRLRSTYALSALCPNPSSSSNEANSMFFAHLQCVEQSLQKVLSELRERERQRHRASGESGSPTVGLKQSVVCTSSSRPIVVLQDVPSPRGETPLVAIHTPFTAAPHRTKVESELSVSSLQSALSSPTNSVTTLQSKQGKISQPSLQCSHHLWSSDDKTEILRKAPPRDALGHCEASTTLSTVHGAGSGVDGASLRVLLHRDLWRVKLLLEEVCQLSLPTAPFSSPLTPEPTGSL